MDVVAQYHAVSMQLINEAIDYAKNGAYDENVATNIRQIMIVTQVLLAAIAQAQSIPPPPPPPPEPLPEGA
jgi:hypothetical protein